MKFGGDTGQPQSCEPVEQYCQQCARSRICPGIEQNFVLFNTLKISDKVSEPGFMELDFFCMRRSTSMIFRFTKKSAQLRPGFTSGRSLKMFRR